MVNELKSQETITRESPKDGGDSKYKIIRYTPWLIHFNTGACNGCDIEVLAAITPLYDPERFGIKLAPSIRHADILVVTGAVTKKAAERLKRLYEQMPDPKFVVAVGACAISGGVFHNSYSVLAGTDKVIPVDIYVPGCPPRPEAILDGIVKLLKRLESGETKAEK
ncbi:NADH-quinone oxidoreductase, B subunit [Staphylothermus marinus F1]|uniref:NADH-quinone oxidoreductase, B subunit n=1 Tax=Staphylothermus marinus (strain ATCC 43588 / DSM 3639 / JCM 9404 / F1) TaxID=399550 RepID=A3DKH2_STAMF|nr:NADH-quinone oxidoreductase subunit B family protein [Staphylothermus marinus]ABN69132.1 NADH-quinone oxidoreductase, B subunit [Staphylothermus marinus F1]